MIQLTSIASYDKLVRSGKVKGLRLAVVSVIAGAPGPMTSGEVIKEVQTTRPKTQMNSLSPRFAELEEMGVLEPAGERTCRVTGKLAIIWRFVCGPITIRPPREKQGRYEAMRREIMRLQKIIEEKDLEIQELKKRMSKWGRPSKTKQLEKMIKNRLLEFPVLSGIENPQEITCKSIKSEPPSPHEDIAGQRKVDGLGGDEREAGDGNPCLKSGGLGDGNTSGCSDGVCSGGEAGL
jgi:hypothetical protein